MKKIIKYITLFIIGLFIANTNIFASNKTYVDLDNFKYSIDGKTYEEIKEYEELEGFLTDYNNNDLPKIYITKFLFDGVSSVKSPDLDDFIENNSNDTKIKTLEINVVNINTYGNIELTGTTKGTMIAVNTNNVTKDINLILNNVNIDTDSKKAPAIFIYNKETTYTDCKVTIKTKKGTKNYLEGGKLKKVSLLASDELDNYISNYTGEALTNYQTYTSYYGIYTKKEIENILFATVKADNEDLSEGDPLYFYKGSGAISSDIDLYFEGEGYLKVTSKNKEGIETKGNLTFSGGSGDYEIYSYDDCLNTTTASTSGTNVRNTMIIDVNSLLAIVDDEGDEGDAIDSNGSLTINGGTIYAYSHSNSEDAGLDSESGTYINGGTIIATGNMADMISDETKQQYIYANFTDKISKDTTILIKDQKDNVITAFKTTKDITTLFYTSESLDYESIKIYTLKKIDGEETNGLYSKINDYEIDEELSYTLVKQTSTNKNKKNNFILILLISEISLLFIILLILFIIIKLKK